MKQVMKYTGSNPIYYLETTGGTVTTRRFFLDRTEALNAAAATGQDESDIVIFEYGDDIGFVLTDFVYPGELTCNPGDTVTSVLDKIIAVSTRPGRMSVTVMCPPLLKAFLRKASM